MTEEIKQNEQDWLYGSRVKEHFFNPKNFLDIDKDKDINFNGMGIIGNPTCGDMMKFWILVDPDETIKECRWLTYGCASAIASSSVFSEMVKRKKIDQALKITPQDIIKELGGLPTHKIHCSVLCDKAFRQAANDYFRNTNQYERVVPFGEVIDPITKTTKQEIEALFHDGVNTLEKIQQRTKAGVGNREIEDRINSLLEELKDDK